MKNLQSILARTGAVCLLVLLVGLSALLGCKPFKNERKAEIVAAQYVTLGIQDPGETPATVVFWLENKTFTVTATITEYGVPSPQSVSVEAKGSGDIVYAHPARTEVHLTCFVPTGAGGGGTLQLQVNASRTTTNLTVQKDSSGMASVSPDVVQVSGY